MRSLAKLLLLIVLSITGCKHPETEEPACPLNQIRTKGTCECDERSIPYKGGCEFVGGLTGGIIEAKGNVAVAVHSSCNDWTDSATLLYYIKNSEVAQDSVESISMSIYTKNSYIAGGLSVREFRKGVQYGTIKCGISHFDGPTIDKWMNCYMRINKQGDSIFAKLCTTNPIGSLKYPDLDSCFVTFVKIY